MTEATKQSIASGDKLTPETFADFVQRLEYHCRVKGLATIALLMQFSLLRENV